MAEIEQIALFWNEFETLKLCVMDDLTQEKAGAQLRASRRIM